MAPHNPRRPGGPLTDPALLSIYERYLRGELPAGVAAMQALMEAESAQAARAALPPGAEALGPLLTDDSHRLVQTMLGMASHHEATPPETWASTFDQAVALSPEASVALYSLGDAARLAAATAEVADWLRAEQLIGPRRRVLEIGCGIGRFLEALSGDAALMVGLDVSAGMCAEAARRVAGQARAAVVRTGGRDLAALRDGIFDLVLAVDSWPYLVNAGLDGAMFAEAARVLSPAGDLVILNWSYRGDPVRDRGDADWLAKINGLENVEHPAPQLTHWNGVVFRFAVKPG